MMQNAFDVATAQLCVPTLLEASAGTGKTFSIKHLVLRFIVEAGIPVSALLVMTFTRAATTELRVRIAAHLTETLGLLSGRLSGDEVEPLVLRQVGLWREAGLSDDTVRGRLEDALAHFDDAGIFTIHSFCQRTLESTAFSSGAGIGFEMQQDLSELEEEVVRDFLRRELDGMPDEADRRELADGSDWSGKLRKLGSSPAGLMHRSWDLDEEEEPVGPAVRAALERFEAMAPAELAARKREAGVRTFEDLLADLYALVCPPEDASGEARARAERLRGVIRQCWRGVLVDEFQDTDPVQYAILEKLFLPPDGDPAVQGEPRPVWFVGDPKQAIYSFRSADLNTYLRARRRIEAIGAVSALGVNYRSSEGLVEAFNAFWTMSKTPFLRPGLDYRPVAAPETSTGLWVRDGDAWRETKPLEIWAHLDDAPVYGNAGEADRAMLDAIGLRIVEWIEAGRRGGIGIESKTGTLGEGAVDRHGRPVRLRALEARDIAVLVRTNEQAETVRKALAGRGVRVQIDSRCNVCATEEAVELLFVLRAFAAPGDVRALRAVRATRLVGETLRTLDGDGADGADGEDVNGVVVRGILEEGAKRWFREGPAPAIERLMAACRTRERLLPQSGGEERLVNYAHVIELLHAAAGTITSPAGLAAWLEEAGRKDSDERMVRLSSDANLVTVQTLHKSKGLQYPVVFLAYANRKSNSPQASSVRLWPDADGRLELHLTHRQVKASDVQNNEADEEAVRLAYVGMTRAAKHLVLPFHQRSKSPKNVSDWHAGTLRNAAFMALTGSRDPSRKDVVAVFGRLAASPFVDLREVRGTEVHETVPERLSAGTDGAALAAAPARDVWSGWRTSSFSGISRMTEDEASSGTLYGVARRPEASADILGFPKGAQAGTCLHEILERADFAVMAREEASEQTLAFCRTEVERHLSLSGGALELAAAGAAQMLRDVLSAELVPGLRLRDVPPEARTAELEFLMPMEGGLTAERLAQALEACGYALGTLRPERLQGYLTGFIDLAFAWRGRFYVLDWKSNRIADTPEGYGSGAMDAEMKRHLYRLQYLIYLVALRRFLRARLGEAWRDDMIGGAIYVFLRGVREQATTPAHPQGIVFDPVDPAVIRMLDDLFSGRTE